ncbi:hypothetical protein D3C77_409470 [compost metagenome]
MDGIVADTFLDFFPDTRLAFVLPERHPVVDNIGKREPMPVPGLFFGMVLITSYSFGR